MSTERIRDNLHTRSVWVFSAPPLRSLRLGGSIVGGERKTAEAQRTQSRRGEELHYSIWKELDNETIKIESQPGSSSIVYQQRTCNCANCSTRQVNKTTS